MFKTNREISNLEDKVDNLEARTVELARMLKDLKDENLELYRENKVLRWEKQEIIDVLDEISKIATSNTYGNEKAILGKINELSTTNAKQYR